MMIDTLALTLGAAIKDFSSPLQGFSLISLPSPLL
jgi:hypothetical protein